ncbi:MAG TPA: hypothetical protein VI873_04345, partial [Candidatus Peribacteraceae bacterium]|nr:hypothetical protein [Candidatus Peribacteraceae bacterium]
AKTLSARGENLTLSMEVLSWEFVESYEPQLQTTPVLRDDVPPGRPPIDTAVCTPGWNPEPNQQPLQYTGYNKTHIRVRSSERQQVAPEHVSVFQRLVEYAGDVSDSVEEIFGALAGAIDTATKPAPKNFSTPEKVMK